MAGPSMRSGGAIAYDSDRGVTVLWGGFRPLAALGDTWEWNGKQWKLVSESGPGPRCWPGLAYDSKRKRTILFGGEDEKSHFFSDTWAWHGKAWTRIATEGPPARIQFVMGYDSSRDRVVLFGGVNDKPQRLPMMSGSSTGENGYKSNPDLRLVDLRLVRSHLWLNKFRSLSVLPIRMPPPGLLSARASVQS